MDNATIKQLIGAGTSMTLMCILAQKCENIKTNWKNMNFINSIYFLSGVLYK